MRFISKLFFIFLISLIFEASYVFAQQAPVRGFTSGSVFNTFSQANPFDFSLTNGGNKSTTRGVSVSNTITANLISPPSRNVTLTASAPLGITVSWDNATVLPTGTRNISLLPDVSPGNYTITITGTSVSRTFNCKIVWTPTTMYPGNHQYDGFYFGCSDNPSFNPLIEYDNGNGSRSDQCINTDQDCKIYGKNSYKIPSSGAELVRSTRARIANEVCGVGNWTLNGNEYAYATNFTCTSASAISRTTSFILTVLPPTNTIPKPDLTPAGAPFITKGTKNTDGSYVSGTPVTFEVYAKNIGTTFTSPAFNVKLQAKLSSDKDINHFADLSFVGISGGIAQGAIKTTEIKHTSAVGDNQTWDFRYCVDFPPNDYPYEGLIKESNEGNNCSGSTSVSFNKFEPITNPNPNPVCIVNCGGGGDRGSTPPPVGGGRIPVVIPPAFSCNAYRGNTSVPDGGIVRINEKITWRVIKISDGSFTGDFKEVYYNSPGVKLGSNVTIGNIKCSGSFKVIFNPNFNEF